MYKGLSKNSLSILGIFLLIVFIPLTSCIALPRQNLRQNAASGGVVPMPLISRNVPVFASSEIYPATNANDASYDTEWRSNGPGWIAYDLSSVPTAQRSKVDVVWYGNCCSYDNAISGTGQYNLPGNYTIEVNAAAGGTSAPSGGWVTLVTVTGNTYHSRQHVIDLTGYNWVRMNVTAIDGSAGNTDVAINLDVFDASAGTSDDWIFYGDSITEGAMGHETENGIVSFPQLINAKFPNNFPVEENGGIGFQTTTSALTYIDKQLALFPGKYVGLTYGTNDAGVNGTTFYNNYVLLVQKVLNAGKVPIVPTIPWGCISRLQNDDPTVAGTVNYEIQQLYKNYPQVIKGPDLWTYFKTHQSLIYSDCIHPSIPNGMGAYRHQWVNAMIANVYQSSNGTTPTAPPAVKAVPPTNTPIPTQQNNGLLGWSSGYYVGWKQGGYPPQTIPWRAITHLIQFPLLPTRDGSVVPSSQLTPAFMRAAVAEAHQHNIKILISVGGAGNNNFDVVCSPTIRNTFINNLVNVMQTYGYDGIDLDIEQDFGYPAHTDYIACVQGVRSALDKIAPRPTLTMAVDPGWQSYMASQVWQYVDQINLMSYFDNVNVTANNLNNFTSRGIPKSKLGIGLGVGDSGGIDTNAANCNAKTQYAVNNGYGGVMEWTITDDQLLHNGQTPCLDAVSNYVLSH